MRTAREIASTKPAVQVLAFADGSKARRGDAELARKVLKLRNSHGLTLREVAEATGISYPHLSQLENAHLNPSVEKIARLCAFYEVSLDYLCGHMVEAAKGEG